jgi:hypothetical protein
MPPPLVRDVRRDHAVPPQAASDGALVAGTVGGRAAHADSLPAVAVLLLVRVRPWAVPWLLARLVLGARGVGQVPGLRFVRVLGSGQGGGFGLRPGLDHGGLFLLFDEEAEAESFISQSPVVAAYRAHAGECLVGLLRATSCRGSWGGQSMAVTAVASPGGPVAALTRGSIRPQRAWAFWRHAAPSQHALAQAQGCLLAAGLGEAPLLRQATFSLWRDAQALEAYAHQGAHRQASVSARQEGYFSESMFVRFMPLWLQGRWQGRDHG